MNKFVPIMCILALAGCSSTHENVIDDSDVPASTEAQTYYGPTLLELQQKVIDENLTQVPDWYVELPEDETSVFSVGSAVSKDLQLAVDKSLLTAKRILADRIDGKLSSKSKEFVSRIGQQETGILVTEIERVTQNVIAEVDVSGYSVKEVVLGRSGHLYRAYTLLEYNMGEANKLLMSRLIKSSSTESRLRAKKAFDLLDATVEEKVARDRAAEAEVLEVLE